MSFAKYIPQAQRLLSSFWVVAVAILGVRIFALIISPSTLGPDEFQYWYWSRDLSFGYFSKPPMIAWAIAATTSIFGHEEWAVRLAAPFFHTGTAALLYLTAKDLFDQRTAYWTGLAWLTIPGVTLSSFLITTDAPLLFFWAAALFFLFRLLQTETPRNQDYMFLGVAIGLGLLSKYAMIYFAIAMAGGCLFIPIARQSLVKPAIFLTIATTVIIITPNLLWNIANDFQTVSHTAANANWGASLFKPGNLFSFISEQFIIAGPIFLVAFIWACVELWRKRMTLAGDEIGIRTMLYFFALTPLIVVSLQAFISRAHANWAVAAYPTIVMLSVAWLFERRANRFVTIPVILHILLGIGFIVGLSNFSLVDRIGLAKATEKIRGWEEQSQTIAKLATGYDAVMLDDRALMGAMLYYERDTDLEIVAIDPNASVSHHYEAFKAFDPDQHKRVLFATTLSSDAHINYRFNLIEPLGENSAIIGDDQKRTYHLFSVAEYLEPSKR